jgi:hypothetical protein
LPHRSHRKDAAAHVATPRAEPDAPTPTCDIPVRDAGEVLPRTGPPDKPTPQSQAASCVTPRWSRRPGRRPLRPDPRTSPGRSRGRSRLDAAILRAEDKSRAGILARSPISLPAVVPTTPTGVLRLPGTGTQSTPDFSRARPFRAPFDKAQGRRPRDVDGDAPRPVCRLHLRALSRE